MNDKNFMTLAAALKAAEQVARRNEPTLQTLSPRLYEMPAHF